MTSSGDKCEDCSDPKESGEGGGEDMEVGYFSCVHGCHIVYICHVRHVMELLLYGPEYRGAALFM